MIVAIIPDKFSLVQAKQAAGMSGRAARKTGLNDVRRPTRGIQLKDDTYATLKVLKGDGVEIPLVNAGSRHGSMDGEKMVSAATSNFLIQSVTEERMEKQQVVETFGESFIFFFGERPRILNIQGVLLNTFDFNWEAEWWYNYDNYLRGTKCVENDARVFLTYDDTLVSGYIISTSSGKNAQEKNHVGFMFQLFVTDYTQISQVGNPNPNQAGSIVPASGFAAKMLRQGQYGPMALPYSRNPRVVPSLSLTESLLRQGIKAVQDTMKTARTIANAALMPAAYLDQFLWNPVRVPIGFQGAVALDETKIDLNGYFLANRNETGLDTPIQYTSTFGEGNDDEFVDSGAYAGSEINMRDQDWSFKQGSSVGAYEAVRLAEWQWRQNGLIPPNDEVSNMMKAITKNPIGMMVVGSARNWLASKGTQVSSKLNQVVDKAVPIAAQAQYYLETAAVVDNLVGAVSPTASQAVDKAVAGTIATTSGYLASSKQVATATAGSPDSFKGFSENAANASVGGEPAQTETVITREIISVVNMTPEQVRVAQAEMDALMAGGVH
jgi:hypothetical protein